MRRRQRIGSIAGNATHSSNVKITLEDALLSLVNNVLDTGVYIEAYQKIELSIYNQNSAKDILKKFKFKDVGSVYDYPDDMPTPGVLGLYDILGGLDEFERIVVSKKYNSVGLYSSRNGYVYAMFLIDNDYLKRFSKISKKILENQDSYLDVFRGIDFKCKNGSYIEVRDSTDRQSASPIEVNRKKVASEDLVFDKDSVLSNILDDIKSFFSEETKSLYNKMKVPHKRGIILHGEPGNGKSATIREIIRIIPDITKIVINPGVGDIIHVLNNLIKSLNNRPAIIILEDLDSLVNSHNRSLFLNVLDGIDIKSGLLFIGTTNYPERLDPAIVNRAGRFDRTYKVGNPSKKVRRLFFENMKIHELVKGHQIFRNSSKEATPDSIIDLYVKYSRGLPMASLKEIVTSSQYILVTNEDKSVEEALYEAYTTLSNSMKNHRQSHSEYLWYEDERNSKPKGPVGGTSTDFDDDEDEEVLPYSRDKNGFIKIKKKSEENKTAS